MSAIIPTDHTPTEADMVTAFEGQRSHTATSEPYFWELSSKPLSASLPIPIDCTGQAHVYKFIPSAYMKEETPKLICHTNGDGNVTVRFAV